MAEPFLGQISIFSFNFAPKGWALCNGQTLPINQNAALFSLLGTTYGGNGVSTFQLPNLQGRIAPGMGEGLVLGELSGEESHTLVLQEMPLHTHQLRASSAAATVSGPSQKLLANSPGNIYTSVQTGLTTLAARTVTQNGSGQPHENRQPHLVVNFCIALQGIFPSRN